MLTQIAIWAFLKDAAPEYSAGGRTEAYTEGIVPLCMKLREKAGGCQVADWRFALPEQVCVPSLG